MENYSHNFVVGSRVCIPGYEIPSMVVKGVVESEVGYWLVMLLDDAGKQYVVGAEEVSLAG